MACIHFQSVRTPNVNMDSNRLIPYQPPKPTMWEFMLGQIRRGRERMLMWLRGVVYLCDEICYIETRRVKGIV